MNNIFSYRLFIWITCFGIFFGQNFVFFIYKYIYLYCNLQWNTFWFDTYFPIKWCWLTTYKKKQKTYILDGAKKHRIETKNTCHKLNILYIHGYVSKRGVLFWFQKGFFERKNGHLILRHPPPHTHVYIYKHKFTHTHIFIYIYINIYLYIYIDRYIYIYKFEWTNK